MACEEEKRFRQNQHTRQSKKKRSGSYQNNLNNGSTSRSVCHDDVSPSCVVGKSLLNVCCYLTINLTQSMACPWWSGRVGALLFLIFCVVPSHDRWRGGRTQIAKISSDRLTHMGLIFYGGQRLR
jgi:hypothetical protein